MPKSKNVEKLLDTVERAVVWLVGVVKEANKFIDEFNQIKEELTPAQKEDTAKAVETEPQPTLEEVRTVLADLSRRGYTSNVRLMLVGLGVSKLSEVDPKDYKELLAKAKELNDATKD